jgi:hypothetical protein
MDKVSCDGDENRLFDCAHTHEHNCGHSEDVNLACDFNDPEESVEEGTLRLADPMAAMRDVAGLLETHHDNQWGTICDDDFGSDEAKIACQQLGCACNGAC